MLRQPPLLPFAIGGALGTLVGVLGAAWYVSVRVSPEPRRTIYDGYTFTPWELGLPYEAVSFPSADGLRLSGWWLPHADPRGVIVGCHGHAGRKDELLGIGAACWRAGYSLLLFDFRGRGDSDPWPQTLVSREVDDLHAALAYARDRAAGLRIGLLGYSMGAAVALLAAADAPDVAAVVADSSFSAGREVVADAVRSVLPLPPEVLVLAADELVHLRHGYRFSRVRPVDAIARLTPRPVLLIHGAADHVVPVTHAQRLYAAAGEPRELWIVDGADHCGAYFADRVTYCRRVTGFFDQYLGSIA
ncbi:MAG: alpha/beta hydrolase [Chloroflexi bacterium]|nr:alpha/beta hydrolase [Chloroflexota bacterium]